MFSVLPSPRSDHSRQKEEPGLHSTTTGIPDLEESITRLLNHGALMRCAAASSASLGFCRPCVMLFSADSIADQNLPISGRLGINSPVLIFAIVAAISGSLARVW